MKTKTKRWAPRQVLARRVCRMLLLAHREKVIELGAVSFTQLVDWQWTNPLAIGPRMKLGALWRAHGRKLLEHRSCAMGVDLAPEQRERLEDVLEEAS